MNELRKRMQAALIVLLGIAGIVAAHAGDPSVNAWMTATASEAMIELPTIPPSEELTRSEVRNKINLNEADAWMLTAVPGVGVSIAQRMIDYRDAHGGFVDMRELLRVEGIGEKLYAVLCEYVEVF